MEIAEQAKQALEDEAADEKTTYEGGAEKKLANWGSHLDNWTQKAKDKGTALSDKSKDMLAKAKEKKAAAMDKLKNLKAKGGDAWKDAKPHLDAAIKEVEQAYREAARTFTKEPESPEEQARNEE